MERVVMGLMISGMVALTAWALFIRPRMMTAVPAAPAAGQVLSPQAPATPPAETATPKEAAGPHAGHGAIAATESETNTLDANEPESTREFRAANAAMHEGMAIKFTGNADADFVRGMIPHHQGAIDMARVVLKHGGDPAIRKLAQGVIAAQEAEIKTMQEWLAKLPQ